MIFERLSFKAVDFGYVAKSDIFEQVDYDFPLNANVWVSGYGGRWQIDFDAPARGSRISDFWELLGQWPRYHGNELYRFYALSNQDRLFDGLRWLAQQ